MLMQFRKKHHHVTGETRTALSLSTGTGSLDHSKNYASHTTKPAELPTKVVNSLPKCISFKKKKKRNSLPKCIFI